jgi:hypothetical protein
MTSLRRRVERAIRTAAIPPCHWLYSKTRAASPSNPKIAHAEILRHDDPRSPQLWLPLLQTRPRSRSQLAAHVDDILSRLKSHLATITTGQPRPISNIACAPRICNHHQHTGMRAHTRHPSNDARSKVAAPAPSTSRWWWLDPNLPEATTCTTGDHHHHGRKSPLPNPAVEALPPGHALPHHLTDPDTGLVTDVTKYPMPATRLQP